MKLTSFALLALLAIYSTASAQLAPQRTWPELKEAVQEHAESQCLSDDRDEVGGRARNSFADQQSRSRRMGGSVEPDG